MSKLNQHIGSRIRLRRVQQGISQDALARLISVTFQQVQKYENGKNGLSAERLFQMAESLHVPIMFFFLGYGGDGANGLPCESSDRETMELVKAFNRIADKLTRKRICELVRAVGKVGE